MTCSTQHVWSIWTGSFDSVRIFPIRILTDLSSTGCFIQLRAVKHLCNISKINFQQIWNFDTQLLPVWNCFIKAWRKILYWFWINSVSRKSQFFVIFSCIHAYSSKNLLIFPKSDCFTWKNFKNHFRLKK